MSTFESAVYEGEVFHRRSVPKVHEFTYHIYLWFLKLDEIASIDATFPSFNAASKGLSRLRFDEQDYVEGESGTLRERILKKMSRLANASLNGDIFFMGQLRTYGIYFSPVNFYFLRNHKKTFSHMLAEVSNTPWNERHYYLVDLEKQDNTEKALHVSPFNPMDMVYKWRIKNPADSFNLHLSCYKGEKHFEAALDMKKLALSPQTFHRLHRAVPSMTIKTVVGIYWQALKLFMKKIPIYSHPSAGKQKGNNDVA